MKKGIVAAVVLLAAMHCASCNHTTTIGPLSASVMNRPLPDNVVKRTFLPPEDTGMYMYNMPQLVGTIMTCSKTTAKCDIVVRVTKKQKEPTNQFLQDKASRLYRSVIDNQYSGGATVLPVTVGVSDKRKVEVIIDDSMCVSYNDEDIPRADLVKAYKALRKKMPDANIYWVRGAILMTITRTYYDEISDTATITAPVFSVNGKIFMSKDEFAKEQRVVVHTLDLEKLASLESLLIGGSRSADEWLIGTSKGTGSVATTAIPAAYYASPGAIKQVLVSDKANKYVDTLGLGAVPMLFAIVPEKDKEKTPFRVD